MVNRVMSIRDLIPKTPLMTTKHLYIGESNDHWIYGKTYTVISSGYHWHKEFGYGTWMTSEEHPDTTDSDYGVFIDSKMFYKLFNHL